MVKIALSSSELATWYQLIVDAEMEYGERLEEELESYLVFLLMRFVKNPELAKSVLALDFLDAVSKVASQKSLKMQEVGDKCLLYAGFFPEQAHHKRVNASYFVKLGQSAYKNLADGVPTLDTALFNRLGDQFVLLMDILFTARKLNPTQPGLSPIDALTLWEEAGSHVAHNTLHTYSHGFWIASTNKRIN